MAEPNFIECADVISANQISLEQYTFVEGLSAKRGVYIFKVRQAKRK